MNIILLTVLMINVLLAGYHAIVKDPYGMTLNCIFIIATCLYALCQELKGIREKMPKQ